MKGYKAFNPDFTCREYQFSENSEHKINGKPILCEQGFHFCKEMTDCFKYYPLSKDTIICEVEAIGDVVREYNNSKHATNHIKILNIINMTFDELLTKLSNHKYWGLRAEVAKNPNTSSELLDKLSNDEVWAVRQVVANNPNTPSEILTKLSDDKNKHIRVAVAINTNTYSDILDKLCNDDYFSVKCSVASNPNTSIDTLTKLSDDKDLIVRETVRCNPNYKK